ncbi:hypothetical protein L195_g045608, partial [Trifolium pratense]
VLPMVPLLNKMLKLQTIPRMTMQRQYSCILASKFPFAGNAIPLFFNAPLQQQFVVTLKNVWNKATNPNFFRSSENSWLFNKMKHNGKLVPPVLFTTQCSTIHSVGETLTA